MPTCRFCGETMPAGKRTCTLCGSELPDVAPPSSAPSRKPAPARPAAPAPKKIPPGGRYCPACGIAYDREYTDAFCICGTELQGAAPAPPPKPAAPPKPAPVSRPLPKQPPAGTRCLVLVGTDRQPLQYFALTKDVTLVGRLDAASGSFPDIDVDEWLDAPTARKVSRQHALILHSRATSSFSLRPLPGNTGTQLETEMVVPDHDYPLPPGSRIILGGAARFRFEIV